jgi:hypothetical protein
MIMPIAHPSGESTNAIGVRDAVPHTWRYTYAKCSFWAGIVALIPLISLGAGEAQVLVPIIGFSVGVIVASAAAFFGISALSGAGESLSTTGKWRARLGVAAGLFWSVLYFAALVFAVYGEYFG